MENIIDDLNWRGLIKSYSNEEKVKELLSTKQTIYCGFDPSASSMHLGNFLMISTLMRFQKAGHKIIAVVGGATGMIGDPSGKSKERNLQTLEKVRENTNSIKGQLSKYLDLDDPEKGIILNNYEWLSKLSLLDYLRDYAKLFNVSYMLSKDIVASRLENGISLGEFSYMTLQSIDFHYLYKNYGCRLQVGGSDQWGNLTTGLDLIRKIEGSDAEVECMVNHLITRSDGKKFGKSEEGALFLDPNLTSPYKLYQFLINQNDDDAIRYLKVFTFLSKDEILKIEKEHLEHLGERIGQKALAYEVTKTIHGEKAADEAKKMSEVLFSNDIEALSENAINELFGNFKCESEPMILEDLLISINAAKSKREAREFISNGAILINGKKITDPKFFIDNSYSLFNKYLVIKRGKKNYFLCILK